MRIKHGQEQTMAKLLEKEMHEGSVVVERDVRIPTPHEKAEPLVPPWIHHYGIRMGSDTYHHDQARPSRLLLPIPPADAWIGEPTPARPSGLPGPTSTEGVELSELAFQPGGAFPDRGGNLVSAELDEEAQRCHERRW